MTNTPLVHLSALTPIKLSQKPIQTIPKKSVGLLKQEYFPKKYEVEKKPPCSPVVMQNNARPTGYSFHQ